MRQLLDDLLLFSRVAAMPEPFKEISLSRIVREAADVFEEELEQSGGLVEIENLPDIEADETQIRRLFQNLIGNALKFHSSGKSPFVKVSSQRIAEKHQDPDGNGRPGKGWQITVQDNGIGFDEKYVDRIFGVFQRLHGRSEYEGSGIGLAICRKIVQRHGGIITAKSAPGAGAAFIFTLPISNSTKGETGYAVC
jgi:signal transduction histidine kinase